MLDNLLLDIPCPRCTYQFNIAYIDIRLQTTVICHNCKVNIQLIDNDASVHLANKATEKVFSDLTNLIKKFK